MGLLIDTILVLGRSMLKFPENGPGGFLYRMARPSGPLFGPGGAGRDLVIFEEVFEPGGVGIRSNWYPVHGESSPRPGYQMESGSRTGYASVLSRVAVDRIGGPDSVKSGPCWCHPVRIRFQCMETAVKT